MDSQRKWPTAAVHPGSEMLTGCLWELCMYARGKTSYWGDSLKTGAVEKLTKYYKLSSAFSYLAGHLCIHLIALAFSTSLKLCWMFQ